MNSELQNKVKALYSFAKELLGLKYNSVRNISEYNSLINTDKLPYLKGYVYFPYSDIDDDIFRPTDPDKEIILAVKKPDFTPCPEPTKLITPFIDGNIQNFNINSFSLVKYNNFSDDKEKEEEMLLFLKNNTININNWIKERDIWVGQQLQIEAVRNLFKKLYQIRSDLALDSENREFMVGVGMLNVKNISDINHPILLKHMSIDFDSVSNLITVCDTEKSPELYEDIFGNIDDIQLSAVNNAITQVKNDYIHPIDKTENLPFLTSFVHSLSSEGDIVTTSKRNDNSYITISMLNPIFFVRKKINGAYKLFNCIIENINNTGIFPASIGELVSGGKTDIPEIRTDFSIEERLSQANGENREILLSKIANREQLEIAERIEKYNAVLVQGPPGTGKTHTIANLLGHFLAQGKSVLVTSYTSKALAVLKDKLPEPIKNLCVSIIGEDSKDMEKSIDAISEYTSSHSSSEIQRKVIECEIERNNIITKLDDIRKDLYRIKKREFSPVVFLGESLSVKQASEFIINHTHLSEIIPGKVTADTPLPISEEEFEFLFKYNTIVSENEEKELDSDLPNPDNFISSEDFFTLCQDYNYSVSETQEPENLNLLKGKPSKENLTLLKEKFVTPIAFSQTAEWILYAVADGKAGGGYKKRWEDLCKCIKETSDFSNENISVISANKVDIPVGFQLENLQETISATKELLTKKSKIGKLDLFFHKDIANLIKAVKLNGESLKSAEDCDILQIYLKIKDLRENTAILWNELLFKHGLPEFFALNNTEPERIAIRFIPDITKYITWDKNEFSEMKKFVISSGFDYEKIFNLNKLDSDEKQIIDIFNAIKNTLPDIIENAFEWVEYNRINTEKRTLQDRCNSDFNKMMNILEEKSINSEICQTLKNAVAEKAPETYSSTLNILKKTYEKYHTERKLAKILEKIKKVAPDWAKVIDERKGIYGNTTASVNIYDAWKYRQLSIILDRILNAPYTTLQEENVALSKRLRNKTAELASYKAWGHLIKRTESNTDMRQALNGYKLTVKKIGKGTGKNANFYRQQASEQMSKCQLAVPAWIMPMGKAMETLTPSVNTFDIVIVDEASQCDISCLGVLYMSKKIIIVGDDKQVSPLAVGAETDKINKIRDMYIRDKIPNWHLFEAKTSIYDIALTTFQPLMLREHFRCLPEIIGYSNKLSYDFKIKPLRDSGTAKLDCPVVSYRVKDGERNGKRKINESEANAVVALISACIEQSEYKGLTFGVISLLGNEQSKLIQNKLFDKLSPAIIEERKILCGDSANFQGDERDVIFLSLVDSNEGDGTLRKSGEGVDNSTKQRYNVAASRAKEQLWVVHSLDYSSDLKQGDMRRDLLEYAENPKGILALAETVENQSESPFEEAVAKKLISDGYSLIQQYEVGAYRIDMVVKYNEKMIAIECDGERWHSTEEQICKDMERQSVLERIGWKFIRIRGSEYFRNPQETMARVEKELNSKGVLPQSEKSNNDISCEDMPILRKVKYRAEEIISEWKIPDTVAQVTYS